jgi:hypothetical protein
MDQGGGAYNRKNLKGEKPEESQLDCFNSFWKTGKRDWKRGVQITLDIGQGCVAAYMDSEPQHGVDGKAR